VRVAKGDYPGNVVIDAKRIELLGGHAGGSSAGYAANTPGDFAAQSPATNVTRVIGTGGEATALVLQFTEASGSVVDGFTVTGGRHGIRLDILLTFPWISDVVISRNVVEDNGAGEYEHRGGGLAIYGEDILVRNNTVRNNIGGRGAGMHAEGTNIRVEDNLFEGNVGYNDHGGGVSLSGATTFSRNLVRNNRIGRDPGLWMGRRAPDYRRVDVDGEHLHGQHGPEHRRRGVCGRRRHDGDGA
jgi:hypothetical protein